MVISFALELLQTIYEGSLSYYQNPSVHALSFVMKGLDVPTYNDGSNNGAYDLGTKYCCEPTRNSWYKDKRSCKANILLTSVLAAGQQSMVYANH